MSNATWTLAGLFEEADVSSNDGHVPPVSISSLTDDSRNVAKGSCFVAVPGTTCDGARYIDAAIVQGAAAVVTGPSVCSDYRRQGTAMVRVAEPREALARLAAAYEGLRGRGARPIRLIGVTGTNGKTTVTWLLRAILRAADRRTALLGTVEYDLAAKRVAAPLTTPGAIALCRYLAEAREAGATDAIFEVSSHALDQRRCDGLNLSAAVFTNLSGDHLDYHRTMEAYAAAKRRLFELLPAGGVALINADDRQASYFAEASGAPVVRFAVADAAAEVRAENVRTGRSGTCFTMAGRRLRVEICSALVGGHNVSNLLAAAATAEALGVSAEAIRDGLQSVGGVPGRLQRVEPADWPFSVLVDYAHTDDALRNVLRAARPLTPGRLICVFGCGGDRDRTKRPRMAAAVAELADTAFVTSDNPRGEDPHAIIREILGGFVGTGGCQVVVDADRRAAIFAAVAAARPGDTVLIAGKGHEDYQLVGGRVLQFDDVEVAREALAKRGAAFEGDSIAAGRLREDAIGTDDGLGSTGSTGAGEFREECAA